MRRAPAAAAPVAQLHDALRGDRGGDAERRPDAGPPARASVTDPGRDGQRALAHDGALPHASKKRAVGPERGAGAPAAAPLHRSFAPRLCCLRAERVNRRDDAAVRPVQGGALLLGTLRKAALAPAQGRLCRVNAGARARYGQGLRGAFDPRGRVLPSTARALLCVPGRLGQAEPLWKV